jgi:hypothetical protein
LLTGDASFGPFNISEQEKLEWAFKDKRYAFENK